MLLALWLLVLALQLIKGGASGLRPVLDAVSADGILGHFGFGWLGAYLVMSGSPWAAVAMSLFDRRGDHRAGDVRDGQQHTSAHGYAAAGVPADERGAPRDDPLS